MMTGIDPERRERRLRWAAARLGLRPDAPPEEVRAAWLRLLAREDFILSDEERWGLATLLRRPEGVWSIHADAAADRAAEDRLREEVESFAGRFWDLPPADRRRRWRELTDLCSFAPPLRSRLRLLEKGLDCTAALDEPEEDTRVRELATRVRELFVLRPGPRARARQVFLRRIQDAREEWRAAVRRLRQACPALAALGADLLDKIQTEKPRPKRPPKRPPAQPGEVPAGGNSEPRPLWLFLAIGLGVCGGICGGILRSPSTNSHRAPPALHRQLFDPPQVEDGPHVPPVQGFDPNQKLRIILDRDGKPHVVPVPAREGPQVPPGLEVPRRKRTKGGHE